MDETKIYLGQDLVINDYITVRQPTLMEIVNIGDSEFWQFISMFCANTSSLKLLLDDNGIDWNEISDFEMFAMLCTGHMFPFEKTSLIIKDIDFNKLTAVRTKPEEGQEKGVLYLVNLENPDIVIDEAAYKAMISQVRDIFDYHPVEEFAKDRLTKDILLDDDRQKIRKAQRMKKRAKKKQSESFLYPLLSFTLNHPGFKYKKAELGDVKIAEFMNSVARLQQYERSIALMHGVYFGMIDWDKNPRLKEDLDLLKDV